MATVVLGLSLSLSACAGSESSSAVTMPAKWGALGANEVATYDFLVPNGTGVLIDQGQKIDLMPQYLKVKLGESIRISNQDTRDYMVGPFFVGAGQSLAMRFTQAGRLKGSCTISTSGEFVIDVTE
jgi:hypothetical protein